MSRVLLALVAFCCLFSSLAFGESLGHWIQSQRVAGGTCHNIGGEVICEEGPIQSSVACSWAIPRRGIMCRLVECQAVSLGAEALTKLGFKVVGSDQPSAQNGLCSLYFTDPNFRR